MKWSKYQRWIFENVESGEGHTVVKAYAGTGKTTTLVEALEYLPRKLPALLVAFNTGTRDALEERAPPRVTVSTMHSFGFAQMRANYPIMVSRYKGEAILKSLIGKKNGDGGYDVDSSLWYSYKLMCQTVSLVKASIIPKSRKMLATADQIDDVIEEHEIRTNASYPRVKFIETVQAALAIAAKDTTTSDFDDMIWLPLVHKVAVEQFPRVFIDETQDLSATQVELALLACTPKGRIMAVGDERQAIYTFRGAGSNSMKSLITRLDAKVMELPICYRCATSIVAEAKLSVSDIKAGPKAPEGIVTRNVLPSELITGVAVGDFVLSRTNAPLIRVCLELFRRNKKAMIQGRDFGQRLIGMIQQARKETYVSNSGRKPVVSVTDFLGWLREWREEEDKRASLKKRDSITSDDYVECLYILARGMVSLTDMISKCSLLFGDIDESAGKKTIVLSTTHKAKGLERNRVWVLQDTYRNKPGQEESNLWYVAVTRAKLDLRLVIGVGGRKKKNQQDPLAPAAGAAR